MAKEQLKALFARFFAEAETKGGLDYVYTLVRVVGISSERDPVLQLEEQVRLQAPLTRSWYCSLLRGTEVALGVIHNLSRCVLGEPFDVHPFAAHLPLVLRRREEDRPSELARIASETANSLEQAGHPKIARAVQEAFPASALGSCIDNQPETDEERTAYKRCKEFLRAFLQSYQDARLAFKDRPNLYRLPQFEVLELLVDERVGLHGFRLHFSTGSSAHFIREENRTDATNVIPEVPLTFMMGMAENRREEWRIGDRRLHEVGLPGRYNPAGEWRPLVFPGDPAPLQAEAVAFSEDPDVQGAYFYILCTGHRVLEFAALMRVELPARVMTYGGKIHLYLVNPSTETAPPPASFVYDGWFDLDDISPDYVASALDALSRVFNRTGLVLDSPVAWSPKYSFRIRRGNVWNPPDEDLDAFNHLLTSFPKGPEGEAIDIAVDWYNRGQSSPSPFTAFLCFYIAIESVVQAIFEGEAGFGIGIVALSGAERRRERRGCIQERLEVLYDSDPEAFIRAAYFDCLVGSIERARRVVSAVFGEDSPEIDRLFSKIGGASLADLRSQLAHGLASELSPTEARVIRLRVGELHDICRRFLMRLLLRLHPGDPLPRWMAERRLSVSFDDPRSVQIATSLKGFPSRDWTIQAAWISSD